MIKIASLFGVGFLPKAPGTWGSLFAAALAYLLLMMGREGVLLFCLLLIIAFFVGWRATYVIEANQEVKDPGWIVIDELVGQWIALIPAAWAVAEMGLLLWPAFVSGFFFFRLFDIKKMGPVKWADKRGDALGVMLDDVFAGIIAAIVTVLLAGLYHGALRL